VNFISREQQTIASQRVQIEELEETVRQMRENLAPVVLFPIEWGLSASQTRTLAAFCRAPGGFLTHEQIFIAAGSKAEGADNLVKVHIANLRRKTEGLGIAILKRWGVGYEMTPESLAIIRDVIA
jgi:DNA-binding response OmpR family regulator